MGTTPISSLLSSSTLSQQQIPWTSQFQLLDKEPLNNTYILHHLPTSISYKIKHLTLNKVQHSQIFRQIDLRAHNPSNFVVKLQKVQQYTVKGYCSEHEEVFLMYKHVENSLKEEILNRRFKRERFTEEEIRVIMESGVKGLAYLHEIGCTPKALNTSQILITPQRGILVNDPFLSVGSILAHTMQRQSGQQSQNSQPIYSVPQQEYPSPEKLLYQNDLIEEYNEWLSELFSFGVILLETIFLEPLAEAFYDKSQKKIYYHKVKEKIQEIEQNVQLEKGENSHLQNAQNSLLNDSKYNGFQSSLALSPQKANGLFLLNEIKQDLRRLLSHEPRIRESVYLKYKKNHSSSYQSLNKLKQQSKPNQYGLAIHQYGFKNAFESTAAQNLNQEQNDFAKKYQKLIQQQQSSFADQLHSNNKFAGLEEQQRAYRIDYEDITKRPSPNRFRVVSSSQPHRNDPQPQIPNTKASFVMPVTSEYLINNQNFTSRPIGQSNQTLMSSIQSKPLFHHLGRSNRFSNKEEHKPDINVSSLIGQPDRKEALASDVYTGHQVNYHYQSNGSLSLSPNKQTQPKSLYYEKYLTKDTIPYNTKPIQPSPYSSHFNNFSNPTNPTTHQYSSYLSSLFPQKPSNQTFTNLQTDAKTKNNWISPTIGLPDNNVTRSESKYVLQPEKLEKDANNNSRIGQNLEGKFDYVESSNNRNDYANISPSSWTYDRMIGGNNYASGLAGLENKFTMPMDTNHGKDYNPTKEASQTNAKISLSHSYTQNKPVNTYNYTTTDQYTPASGRYSSELSKQPSTYPLISTNPSTNFTPSYTSTFPSPFEKAVKTPSNFEQWKRANLHLYSQQAIKTGLPKSSSKSFMPKVQNPSYSSGSYLTQINKIPSSKELSHFPIRQVGSINEGQSHFLNDKESFVIESYNGGLNHKQSERHERVQTPISTLNSSNIPNISPKNSFQINHSAISNFRNDGKSFSSVDEDLREFRKFGQMNNNNVVYKPNSSYSSQQKVSVIDKIYDPQVTNSYERRSFENSPQKNQPKDYQGTIPKARNSQNVGNRASQSQNYNSRTSSQNYLQTPERYPGKNRLNSTIREASCEQSGVNQSNSNNDSYQNEKAFPNTEVSKYQAQQDRRMSERKPDKNYEYQTRPIPTEQKNPNQTSNAPSNTDTPIPPSSRVTLYADGSRYMGQTDDQGQSHGYGILYYPDGQVAYQGQWTHGDFNGKGKLFNPYVLQMASSYDYKDLTRMDEYIKEFDGVFVKDVKQGMGMLKMHNEEIYCGEFVGDLPHGRGKFYCSNANVIDGVWDQGLLKSIM